MKFFNNNRVLATWAPGIVAFATVFLNVGLAFASGGEGETVREPAQGLLAKCVAGGILLLTYYVIAKEIWHRALTALVFGGLLLGITHFVGTFYPDLWIIDWHSAMEGVDWNVIFLLLGMMIIVGVLKGTGVFQWMAYKCFALAKGNTFRLAAYLMILTAVASANLDNVTTMLLITPVTLEICRVIGVNPLAFLIPEVLASNVGGTATLIGDPPNIMIGSQAHLTYGEFIINLAPCIVIVMVAHLYHMKRVYKEAYTVQIASDKIGETIAKLREEYKITDAKLLLYGGITLLIVLAMFVLHGFFKVEVAVPAIIGAAVLVVIRDGIEEGKRKAQGIKRESVAEKSIHGLLNYLENEVEWATLVFFIFLFIVVGAVDRVGLIADLANLVNSISGGNLVVAMVMILWISAIASAFIDNIPYVATMIPLVKILVGSYEAQGVDAEILWWALALGACLGGNGTLVGASANIVTSGLAEKAGYKITFTQFFRVAFPAMIIEVFIAMLWLIFVDPLIAHLIR